MGAEHGYNNKAGSQQQSRYLVVEQEQQTRIVLAEHGICCRAETLQHSMDIEAEQHLNNSIGIQQQSRNIVIEQGHLRRAQTQPQSMPVEPFPHSRQGTQLQSRNLAAEQESTHRACNQRQSRDFATEQIHGYLIASWVEQLPHNILAEQPPGRALSNYLIYIISLKLDYYN